jgi:uncharacterized membrane protein YcjF (UPF0283 family)
MSYLAAIAPSENHFQNRLEIAGEYSILLLACILTAFNASNSAVQQENASIIFSVIIGIILLSHLFLLTVISLKALKRFCLVRRLKKQNAKILAKKQSKEAAKVFIKYLPKDAVPKQEFF